MIEGFVGFVFGGVIGYFVGVNRNRANARKELEAIEAKAGEKGAAILASIKERLGL